MFTHIFLLFISLITACQSHIFHNDDYARDEIHHLPGLPWQPSFKHYSGYLKSSPTRKLFYWLVESQRSPHRDPLVVWFNGGPGCSSLNGMFAENGPYLANDDGQTLRYNKYSWNKIANVLYLESPAGVGFSYATDREYSTGDDQTADDNYGALKYFFDKFPHYRGRELILTGESYAGVYIPTLMERFLNKTGHHSHSHINLKGAMIGNGLLTDWAYVFQSNIYYWHSHGLLADSIFRELEELCCDEGQMPTEETCHFFLPKNTQCASKVLEEILKIYQLPINHYNIYAPCITVDTEPSRTDKLSKKWLIESITLALRYLQGEDITQNLQILTRTPAQPEASPSFVQCFPAEGTKVYLQRADVLRAIHVLPRFVTGLPAWSGCSSLVDDATGTYRPDYMSQLDVLTRLTASKRYDILLYYGDQDFVCSFLTGRYALHEVAERAELELVHGQMPWFYTSLSNGSQQLGGVTESYDKFMYLLFKGSGHMVPTDKPYQSFEILKRYLDGRLFGPRKK